MLEISKCPNFFYNLYFLLFANVITKSTMLEKNNDVNKLNKIICRMKLQYLHLFQIFQIRQQKPLDLVCIKNLCLSARSACNVYNKKHTIPFR